VRLLSGSAERDGTELAINHGYHFSGAKSKLLTWHGCTLEVDGECDDYVAEHATPEETPMVSYLNLHFALQAQRAAAAGGRGARQGPRVLVCGPAGSGKTSLARTLAALATRAGHQPLLASVDPREGLLSLPGTMTATVFGTVMDVDGSDGGTGVGGTPSSGPAAVPVKLPLVYYLGRERPEDDVPLWRALVVQLARAVGGKMVDDAEVGSAGVIIDSPAVRTNKGDAELLAHVVEELNVNVVVVLGSARLNAELSRRFARERTRSGEAITVVMLDKSEGVVERDEAFMQLTREAAIKEYFFGDAKRTLSPFTQQVDFDGVFIYKALMLCEFFITRPHFISIIPRR
jgi:polyribonucleotide 5'-hydroxyl-kinase